MNKFIWIAYAFSTGMLTGSLFEMVHGILAAGGFGLLLLVITFFSQRYVEKIKAENDQ